MITLPGSNGNHTNYLVNSSGKLVKNSSAAKDNDGNKYSTDRNGIVTKVNGEAVGAGATFGAPREPDYWE